MDLIPYPPEWCREYSDDIQELWRQESRRRILLFRLFLRDEDRLAAWRITCTAGTLALLLILLLFLEAIPRTPLAKVAFESAVEPAVKTESVEIVQTRPVEPEIDPFEQFAPQPEPQPEKDPFELFAPAPPPKPEHKPVVPPSFQYTMPVVVKPLLSLESQPTDLYPNFQYQEKPISRTVSSRFLSHETEMILTSTGWGVSTNRLLNGNRTSVPASWFKRPQQSAVVAYLPPQSYDVPSSNSEQNLPQELPTDLVLTKNVPPQINGQETFRYQLEIENRGRQKIEYLKIWETVSDPQLIVDVSPAAHRAGDQLYWVINDLLPGEKRTFEISCYPLEQLSQISLRSEIVQSHQLASRTQVISPDVVVSITLPVEVQSGQEFAVEILVENESDKQFAAADLRLKLLKGLNQNGLKDLTSKIQVPGPGQSLKIPLTLTSEQTGEAVMEAELNLDKTITVPVKAYTVVSQQPESPAPNPAPQQGENPEEALVKKQFNRLAAR